MQRPCEKDRERGQSEQGSSCLERVPETFVRRSFLAEPPSGGEIDPLAGRPNQKIAQMLSTSSGGAIHAVIPIQKRKLLFIAAFPSTKFAGCLHIIALMRLFQSLRFRIVKPQSGIPLTSRLLRRGTPTGARVHTGFTAC